VKRKPVVLIATAAATAAAALVLAAAASAAAGFTYHQTGPLTIQFAASSEGAASAWDFGDGQISTEQNPSHTFPRAGTYEVRLIADTGIMSDSVTVYGAPLAAFAAGQVAGTLSVAFADQSSGGPTSWAWSFGDGQGSTQRNPTHAYATPGTYAVSLTVYGPTGSATVSRAVAVAPTPTQGALASAVPAKPPARQLSPFPVVRIRSRVVGTRVYIDLLTVRAPKGTKVSLRCRGRHCPFKHATARARSDTRPVRFRRIERRVFRGTVLEVFVTTPDAIGKYTRFLVRPAQAPVRRDLCLPPGSMRPGACPAQ
jgi:hypothetical protein